jgi:transglutaminase superfamily protein
VRRLRSVWLGARMLAWTTAIRLMRRRPLPRLVQFVRPEAAGSSAHDRDPQRVLALAQLTSRLVSRRPETMCLVRSLVAYRYLCRAGLAPELRIGLAPDHAGHAWLLLDGAVVSDDPAELARYTPILAIASDGRSTAL